jgi:hypothetical protein
MKLTMPRIYVAGPFRAETPYQIERHIRAAEDLGLVVAKMGAVPVIPHTMYRYYQDSLPDEFWLEAGLSILSTCHAVAVVLPHDQISRSRGTTEEVLTARADNKTIFFEEGVLSRPEHGVVDAEGKIVRTIYESGPGGCYGLAYWVRNWSCSRGR